MGRKSAETLPESKNFSIGRAPKRVSRACGVLTSQGDKQASRRQTEQEGAKHIVCSLGESHRRRGLVGGQQTAQRVPLALRELKFMPEK